jgi:Hypothetical protein (DUF2513)
MENTMATIFTTNAPPEGVAVIAESLIMKRDMEIVRQILLFYEDDESEGLPPGDYQKITGHIIIMIQAGLLDGAIIESSEDDPFISVTRLTWAGHDFLSLARNEQVWNQAKSAVKKHLGDVSLDVLKGLLTKASLAILTST